MKHRRRIIGRLALAGTLAALGIGTLQGQDFSGMEFDADLMADLVRQGAQTVSSGALDLGEVEVDWAQVGEWITRALQGESWQELLDVEASAQQLFAGLKLIPGASAQVDWLRQRMDYLSMAEWVMQQEAEAAPTPVRTPVVKSVPTVRPSPTVRPGPTVVKAEKSAGRKQKEKAAASIGQWKKSLAQRPAPKQADALTPRLKQIFREEGIPTELVWLAEVESSMNPQAQSPVGAAGLFQFMPVTAERFGLSTAPDDERLNPEKSARAAAKYLRVLYGQFRDWPLSLAAYNAGEGRVGRILRERKGNSFEDIAEHLPLETRMYVPKILAVIALREPKAPATLPPPG